MEAVPSVPSRSLQDTQEPPSPSSCCEPIDAKPLGWYRPDFALGPPVSASSSSTDQSSLETQASASTLSVAAAKKQAENQSPEPKKDSSEDTGLSSEEILLFGFRIEVSNSDSSLSGTTVNDHQLVPNQNQAQVKKEDVGRSSDSRNGFRLFGTWISKEETGCENKKLGLQETSKVVKKRAYRPRQFKKMAVKEQNGELGAGGSYKENIGELLAEKVLTKSDIDQSSRLLLSRETVEKNLIPILNENYPEAEQHCRSLDGFRMEIYDADTDHENGNSYTLVLKQWVTRSFVFTGNWKKDFVKRRNLKENDEIGLFWDQNQRRFSFSVKQIRL